jgi:hypothetical protein
LFVTYRDENIEEGVSYAVELAKAMYEDITLLLVQKKSNLMEKLENLMTAVSFAEADEHDTARQIMAGGSQDRHKSHEKEARRSCEKMSPGRYPSECPYHGPGCNFRHKDISQGTNGRRQGRFEPRGDGEW